MFYLRGFCHYPQTGVDAGRHSCKTTECKRTDSPLPSLFNVMYCVRVSLWTVKMWVISKYLWGWRWNSSVSLLNQRNCTSIIPFSSPYAWKPIGTFKFTLLFNLTKDGFLERHFYGSRSFWAYTRVFSNLEFLSSYLPSFFISTKIMFTKRLGVVWIHWFFCIYF